jgi:hypothetical protein
LIELKRSRFFTKLQIQLTENLTENEAFYSRSYVPELACQFREEELIMRIKLNGAGIQVSRGLSY